MHTRIFSKPIYKYCAIIVLFQAGKLQCVSFDTSELLVKLFQKPGSGFRSLAMIGTVPSKAESAPSNTSMTSRILIKNRINRNSR